METSDPGSKDLPGHYDEIYSSGEQAFGPAAEPIVVEASDLLAPGAKVIELGAGQGRNSLELARQGFTIVASDISPSGIGQLSAAATEQGLAIETKVAGAVEALDGQFDGIVTTFMLHHLETDEAESLVEKMKVRTNPGGLNVIATFSNDGDFYRADPSTSRFFPDPNGLRSYYDEGWEVLRYENRHGRALQKNPDGSPMFNVAIFMIARKTSG